MKKISIFYVSIFILSFSLLAPIAHAMIPVLSVSSTGTGDSVQIAVSGDPSVSVLLFSGTQSTVLGTTDSSGHFSTVVSSASVLPNGIVANALVYVRTGGLSGSQSLSVSWPYFQNTTTTSTLTLGQTAILLNVGQTSTITASANSLYLLSNSTPAIANVNFNASQITIQALSYGSTVANICVVGSTTNCASTTITVQNSSAQQLTFSQNNFSIISGQSVSVTITGGSGSYTVSNNSNSTSIQTSLSGSAINLTATSTSGTASITVCTTDMNNCGIINVSATTLNSTAISFSQTNPVIAVGQSLTVTIFGGTGTNFYVSANSNPSIVQANVNGNILTLIANATTGTSNITVCAYAGTCGSITANVTSSTNGPISLSQTSVSILAGQSSTITILGGSTPYNLSSSNNSTNIFNGVVNGNILTIYGVNPGTASANVCSSVGCTSLSITINSLTSTVNPPAFSQNNILLNAGQQTTVNITGNSGYYVTNSSTSNIASVTISGSSAVVSGTNAGTTNISICQTGGQCTTLYVTVSGTNTTATQLILSQTNLSLTIGQNTAVYITGNGNYYISGNSNPNIASAQISGSSVVVSAVLAGSNTISVCQSNGQCANLSVVVSAPATTTTTTTTPPTTPAYAFLRYLGYGDKGDDVLQLQKFLLKQGFLTATPNGRYGPATVSAIKKFQKEHSIKQTGNVGPSTKDVLNQILSTSTATNTSSSTTSSTISSIQQQIQQLLAQIAQMQGQ